MRARRSSWSGFRSDAFEQGAIGDASGGEDELLAGSEIFSLVDSVLIFHPHAGETLFLVGLHHQAPEHVAVEAADGGGSYHAFRSSAGTHDGMYAGADDGSGDAGGEITIADEADASAGRANIG